MTELLTATGPQHVVVVTRHRLLAEGTQLVPHWFLRETAHTRAGPHADRLSVSSRHGKRATSAAAMRGVAVT